MNVNVFDRLIEFLNRLDDASIHYVLRHSRHDSVMVIVNVPGERWEVEYLWMVMSMSRSSEATER
jgi:hypothetical protein